MTSATAAPVPPSDRSPAESAPQFSSQQVSPQPFSPLDSDDSGAASDEFRIKLVNFEGPFDLLLTLIQQRRLDVTEVALHSVTDDFLSYTREVGRTQNLEQITEFLVIAATLLDLKTARLLPSGQVEDAEDLALLEARDLLFARLLEFQAFKAAAQLFGDLEAAALQGHPRAVSLENRFLSLLPEVELGVSPEQFAEIAAVAFRPRPVEEVALGHIHTSLVSVPEQARHIMAQLTTAGVGTWIEFTELTADATETMTIVGRFLALLELYRTKAIAFEQSEPLGDLLVQWTGTDPENVVVEEDEWNS